MAFDLLSFLLGKSTGSGGGGGSAALGPKTIRQNGVYRASSDNLDGYNTVTVEVPNSYAAADEGKVVSNGALVAQTSRTITQNGTFDTTLNDEVVVNVSGGSGGDATPDGLANKTWPSGNVVFNTNPSPELGANSGFYENHAITSLKGDAITSIGHNAFRYNSNLESIDFESLTRIGSATFSSQDANTFANCPKLTRFNLPALQSINGQYVFSDCGTENNKAIIALPSIVNMSSRTFRNGYWAAVDLGENLSTEANRGIRDQTFYNGTYEVVILRSPAVIPVTNADAIRRLTTEYGCTIYIPKSLYDHLGDETADDYQSATNWSAATRTYAQIEGSIYETQYADGTPITA